MSERIIGRRDEASQAGAVIVPKPTECPTKPIKRCLYLLAPLSGSVAFEAQEGFHKFLMNRVE
jgi:hypothetical protein